MEKQLSIGGKTAADVGALLRARNPLLWITTREEARVERLLIQSAQAAKYNPIFWDCSTGISDYAGRPVGRGAQAVAPGMALDAIRNSTERQLWILRDVHLWLRDPMTLRGLRTLARNLPLSEHPRAIICLTPSSEIPPELAGHAIVIDWPLPDRSEIAELLDAAIESLPDDIRATACTNGAREAAIDAAVGLTGEEAQSCYAKSLVVCKRIEPATVATEKKRVIAREKVLEWFDPLPGGLDAVGGLDVLKQWLMARKAAFGPRARAYGLPSPKGLLLVGPPGTGKSLTAKAVATAWGMPLLRLDLGALKSKWVGESEQNIRKALGVADAIAPCVLWADEIEKGLAGASGGSADGGVSSDALGALLQWMQDKAGQVFVVATANDVTALPPELLRKGRFDELFFIDLPNEDERRAILLAACKAHGIGLAGRKDVVDVAQLAAASQDFSGAELAALVPDAMFAAFADGERPISTDDMMAALKATNPLARTAAEKITRLREWAKSRARSASVTVQQAAGGIARKLDV